MRGISLFVVLVALVMLSLAAVGLIRMVDTGALVAGNLSFKQATTQAADRAAEQAIAWLSASAKGGVLWNDKPDAGYYASARLPLDFDQTKSGASNFVPDWDHDNCAAVTMPHAGCLATVAAEALPVPPVSGAADTNGITQQVFIMRLCRLAGDPDLAGNSCLRPVQVLTSRAGYMGASLGTGGYMAAGAGGMERGPYFRIIVRAQGPRKTVSYTETTVHFPIGVSP